MKEIYLCDDDNAVRCQIQTALERKILAENYDMKVAASVPTAQELLAGLERGRQGIYFLDVELKDEAWDGFSLGQARSPWGLRQPGVWRRYTIAFSLSGRRPGRPSPFGRETWCAMFPWRTFSILRPPPLPTMSFSIPWAAGWIFWAA